MFKKREGFKKVHLQGLDLWVPPPGVVYDRFTGKLADVHIEQRSEVQAEQYWERPDGYEEYLKRRVDEVARQKDSPNYVDEDCEVFRREMWFKRINGHWFMNNGKPTYITGLHWFYIAWWKIDIGYPDFRVSDQKYFHHLQYCIEDPDCGGQISFAKRRQGKSYRSMAFLYEGISRMVKALGGMQSKNDGDAFDLYWLHLIMPLQELPDFFVPTYDQNAGKMPKNQLRFFSTGKKGALAGTEDDSLGSTINYKNASEKAYDSKKLIRYVADEFGKLVTQYSLLERHRIIKPCLMDGSDIIGKVVYCTTVEDMGGDKSSGVKNIEECKQMAEDSDPANRDRNGRTPSLLYRFFLPAQECHSFDRYGKALVKESLKYFENQFQTLLDKGDFVGWSSERRKYPLEFEDVFRVSASAPIFGRVDLLYERMALLSFRKESELYRRGNLVWEGGKRDSRVMFVESVSGRFLLRIDMNGEQQNIHRPINNHKFAIGIDPYEHKSSFKPSNGAAYGLKKYDPHDNILSNSPIFEYCARPAPSIFFEDMVKITVYLGCEMLCENNRTGLLSYFDERGYGDFCTWLPGQVNPGIFAGERSKQYAAEAMDAYITNHTDKIFFPKLLEDLAKYDIQNSTAFDRAMAFGWTLVAAGDIVTPYDGGNGIVEITDYLPYG